MERTLPATWRLPALPAFPRWPLHVYALLSVLFVVNLIGLVAVFVLMAHSQNEADWNNYVQAGHRAWSGAPLYDWTFDVYEYRYSPLLAYVFGVIAPIGIVGWRLVSLASLLLLPRKLALIALISLPLWLDLYAGNLTTIVFVFAASALAGKRWGIGGYLVLCLLVPRPLMAPVAIWLLWKHPEWRWRFAAMMALEVVILLAMGSLMPWAQSFLGGRSDLGGIWDDGPSRFIGVAWVPIGMALAVWFTWKGRLGYASLAASPYWLAYYPLMLLLELVQPRDRERVLLEAGGEQRPAVADRHELLVGSVPE